MNSKFIQIASDTDTLYALDQEGEVWSYDYRERLWERLSADRDPGDEKKEKTQ